MRLCLINPSNPLVSWTKVTENRWNKYRVWKPLGLLVVAGLTPPGWDITVVDENLGVPHYTDMPRPDLVGITAFTSQTPRAYEVAAAFRARGIPVVMGGIHATMCSAEASERVDAVVVGEAESAWAQVLEDVEHGVLKRTYEGTRVEAERIPFARHDLLPTGYHFGSIQTARGCPLDCSFCSVSAFNGRLYRRRPVESVVQELRLIREKSLLIVDDNLIGTREDHIAGAKDLFRAMIRANLGKKWIAQATINMGDDEELLRLAAKAGCAGVFVGFETASVEGLVEVHKKFNIGKGRDFKASVARIQRHGIVVAGAFIVGLDVDEPGIGGRSPIRGSVMVWTSSMSTFSRRYPAPACGRKWNRKAASLPTRSRKTGSTIHSLSQWDVTSICPERISCERWCLATVTSIRCRGSYAALGALSGAGENPCSHS